MVNKIELVNALYQYAILIHDTFLNFVGFAIEVITDIDMQQEIIRGIHARIGDTYTDSPCVDTYSRTQLGQNHKNV